MCSANGLLFSCQRFLLSAAVPLIAMAGCSSEGGSSENGSLGDSSADSSEGGANSRDEGGSSSAGEDSTSTEETTNDSEDGVDQKTISLGRQDLFETGGAADPTGEERWDEEWGEYPGDASGLQTFFWERDGIADDDPDYGRVDHHTVYEAGTSEVQMGIFLRSVHPVLVAHLDFIITYEPQYLEFDRVERHWASVKQDEPGAVVDVELLAPGRLKFSFEMGEELLYVDPYDRTIASMHFSVLQPGTSRFELYHPPEESWSEYDDFKTKMDKPWSESSPNQATLADGMLVPYHWDVQSDLTVRE